MHHSLLPPPDIKALKAEYRIRLLTVALFFVSFAIVAGAISLFPAYLSVTREGNDLARQAVAARAGIATDTAGLSAQLSQAGATAAEVSSALSSPLSAIVSRVAAYESPGISIASFSVVRQDASSASVVMQGTAASRDDLVAFEDRLKADVSFSGVSVPLADLAPSSDLQFSLQATAATD